MHYTQEKKRITKNSSGSSSGSDGSGGGGGNDDNNKKKIHSLTHFIHTDYVCKRTIANPIKEAATTAKNLFSPSKHSYNGSLFFLLAALTRTRTH